MDRTRNRRGEGRRLRDDILRAAAELLDETGQAQAVTLRAVARRVGIAAPSIYGHFPDRELILLAVVQQAFGELTVSLEAARSAHPVDPAKRLEAICAAYLDFADHRPQRYRVMFGGFYDVTDGVRSAAVTPDDAAALGQDALGVLVDALGACVEAGRSASTDPPSRCHRALGCPARVGPSAGRAPALSLARRHRGAAGGARRPPGLTHVQVPNRRIRRVA